MFWTLLLNPSFDLEQIFFYYVGKPLWPKIVFQSPTKMASGQSSAWIEMICLYTEGELIAFLCHSSTSSAQWIGQMVFPLPVGWINPPSAAKGSCPFKDGRQLKRDVVAIAIISAVAAMFICSGRRFGRLNTSHKPFLQSSSSVHFHLWVKSLYIQDHPSIFLVSENVGPFWVAAPLSPTGPHRKSPQGPSPGDWCTCRSTASCKTVLAASDNAEPVSSGGTRRLAAIGCRWGIFVHQTLSHFVFHES